MTKIEHKVELFHQTPEAVCGPTSVAMQLSALGFKLSPQEVALQARPYRRPTDSGFTSLELATFCVSLGLRASLYSFDGCIMDHSWSGLDRKALESKFVDLCEVHQKIGPKNDAQFRYALSYLNLLRAGGSIRIEPTVTSKLLIELLESGPINAGVAFGDPSDAGFSTHSVLVYGYDDDRGFLVADPAPERGRVTISEDNLLAAISAAQIENDNVIFQILTPASFP